MGWGSYKGRGERLLVMASGLETRHCLDSRKRPRGRFKGPSERERKNREGPANKKGSLLRGGGGDWRLGEQRGPERWKKKGGGYQEIIRGKTHCLMQKNPTLDVR